MAGSSAKLGKSPPMMSGDLAIDHIVITVRCSSGVKLLSPRPANRRPHKHAQGQHVGIGPMARAARRRPISRHVEHQVHIVPAVPHVVEHAPHVGGFAKRIGMRQRSGAGRQAEHHRPATAIDCLAQAVDLAGVKRAIGLGKIAQHVVGLDKVDAPGSIHFHDRIVIGLAARGQFAGWSAVGGLQSNHVIQPGSFAVGIGNLIGGELAAADRGFRHTACRGTPRMMCRPNFSPLP